MINYFKTDGIRGIAQVELDPMMFLAIGGYLAIHDTKRIVVGYDTRESSILYKNALICGITNMGVDVIDLGVTTTPCLSSITKKIGGGYGVMITASHNPYRYNGIKIFDNSGHKIEEKTQIDISKYIDSWSFHKIKSIKIGRIIDGSSYQDEYLDDLLKNFDLSRLIDHRIIIDAANGGSYRLIRRLIDRLHLNNVILTGAAPNGININLGVGSLFIDRLQERLQNENFDLGLALDGDGDRLTACTQKKIIDGDILAYLLVKNNPQSFKSGIVLTANSNRAIIDLLEDLQIPVYLSKVGDSRVLEKMIETNSQIGSESSGHLLYHQQGADGIKSMLLLLSIFQEDPKYFIKSANKIRLYPSIRTDLDVKDQEAFMQKFEKTGLEEEMKRAVGPKGKILIRPSGTEKVIRFLAEAPYRKQVMKAFNIFKNYSEE